MLIKEKEMLVTKTELKKNQKTGEAYLLIDLIDGQTGDAFNIMTKDIEMMGKFEKMTKYLLNLELTGTKFGLKLNIEAVLKKI